MFSPDQRLYVAVNVSDVSASDNRCRQVVHEHDVKVRVVCVFQRAQFLQNRDRWQCIFKYTIAYRWIWIYRLFTAI